MKMKKKIAFILLLILSNTMSLGQEPDDDVVDQMIFGDKVFVNKKVIAYTLIINKPGSEGKLAHEPSMNNPYNIYINSNDNKASIRINNKSFREDIVFNFKNIRKLITSKETMYTLKKDECIAYYTIPKNNDNHNLFVDCLNDNTKLFFTISKYNQL